MGRYVPPDEEGRVSFNTASGKGHALGARARKLKTEGILTVRFELPFAVWCTTCDPEQIIGQGVRFNAEKKKVGNYHTTAIWSFRFKHTVCGGWIEVRTDPKNAEYVVVEGGRKRDTGADKVLDGEIRIGVTEEEKERLEKDGGFGALEKKVEDKRQLSSEAGRIEDLKRKSQSVWADPYEKNKNLRKQFRVGRKEREAEGLKTERLQEKLSLGIEVLGETDEDRMRAALIQFGDSEVQTHDGRPMFSEQLRAPSATSIIDRDKHGRRKSCGALADEKKVKLHKILQGNTRKTVDPFVQGGELWAAKARRKPIEYTDPAGTTESNRSSTALVNYDSDSP